MTVAVIGAGGLGGPIAIAVADAGLDVIVIDPDRVEVGNLHRQIQFGRDDVGRAKAAVLAEVIEDAGGRARAIEARFTWEDAAAQVGDAAVVIDGSDDPPTKFAVARWARTRGRGYVVASALRYGGNVFAAAPGDACYACLFEDPPIDAPSCAEAGVLGPVVGWVGGVAAQAAVALARGTHAGGARIWVLDDLRRARPRTLAIAHRADCECADEGRA